MSAGNYTPKRRTTACAALLLLATAAAAGDELPPLTGAVQWLNSQPLTPTGLQGKVVLVEFWTYTCINWRRTLPYVRTWAQKYKDHGLVVIGVHTPEFSFEKDLQNVQHATSEIGIRFPVAVDSNYAIWEAFRNQYWPAIYLIDAHGNIRYHQFGEGNYQQTETAIQHLLTDAGQSGFSHEIAAVVPEGVEVAANAETLQSPETYVGYELGKNFASSGALTRDRPHVYAAPARLRLNEWALIGDWTIGKEAAALNGPDGRIVYRFHARDVNLIMRAPTSGAPIKFRVRIDGEPPGDAHGLDIDEQGNGSVSEPRMYQLIRQPAGVQDRLFEIEFAGPGAAAFDFTFG